jgi:alkylation response protein AidB-like acyl-CoA dehydrogenase
LNFDFSEEQYAVKQAARDFLSARFSSRKVRELAESESYDEALFREMVGLGWPGIFISPEMGGHGLGVLELVILLEEMGYALAPSPFFSHAAATLMIDTAGSDEQRRRWLPSLTSGEKLGTVGVMSNGRGAPVPDAEGADLIVLVEGDRARVLDRSSASVQTVNTMDTTRRYGSVSGKGGEPLGGDVQRGVDQVAVALSAELVGVAQRALDMSVEYAKTRTQFDRPIGAYQAVSHRCAQMLLETECARSATYFAAWAADSDPQSLPFAASAAKAYASDAGWRVTASALQVHGGIGFTWEHDLHFFLKRAKVDAHLFGTATEHRERVAKYSGL